MATTISENSQPALRPAGRNSNPLVANVISPAFAIKFQRSGATIGSKTIIQPSRIAGPGFEPGPPGFRRALLPCSPAGFPAASNFLKDRFRFQSGPTSFLPRRHSFNVVPGGIRPAKIRYPGGQVSAEICLPAAPPSVFTTSPARSRPPSDPPQGIRPQMQR